jgi:hypothetical protein
VRNTLKQSKSGGDRIRGGEGMESPRNRQAKEGDTPNCLGGLLSHRWEEFREEESPNAELRASQRVLYPGDQTCPMTAPD